MDCPVSQESYSVIYINFYFSVIYVHHISVFLSYQVITLPRFRDSLYSLKIEMSYFQILTSQQEEYNILVMIKSPIKCQLCIELRDFFFLIDKTKWLVLEPEPKGLCTYLLQAFVSRNTSHITWSTPEMEIAVVPLASWMNLGKMSRVYWGTVSVMDRGKDGNVCFRGVVGNMWEMNGS